MPIINKKVDPYIASLAFVGAAIGVAVLGIHTLYNKGARYKTPQIPSTSVAVSPMPTGASLLKPRGYEVTQFGEYHITNEGRLESLTANDRYNASFPVSIATTTADFNGDGKPDIVIAIASGGTKYLTLIENKIEATASEVKH
jgi:hypothetical protein